jgi:hypothetical protein
MSIAIESSDELEQLRARLRKMSDDELMCFGKAARTLCRDPRCPDTFKRQLEETRGEPDMRLRLRLVEKKKIGTWNFAGGRRDGDLLFS